MELVYLWVENYKNIIGQGFNFSPRFECSYDEEKEELTINENKDYVSIFPDNINVTAIVGENGSGKSSILNIIFNLFYLDNKEKNIKKKFLLILKNNNEFFKISNNNFDFLGIKELPKINLINIYMNYSFERLMINDRKKDDSFICEPIKNNDLFRNIIDLDYLNYSTRKKIINIYSDIKNNKILNTFFNPKEITISFETNLDINYSLNNSLESLCINLFEDDPKHDKFLRNQKYDPIMKELNSYYKNREILELNYIYIIIEFLKLDKKDIDFTTYEVLKTTLKNIYISNESISTLINIFKEKLPLIKEKIKRNVKLKNALLLNDYLEKNKIINNALEKNKRISIKNDFVKVINVEWLHINFYDKNKTFDDLSNGEKTLFMILINILTYIKKSNIKILNIFFDEIEITLHPSWQKKIFREIYDLIEKLKYKTINIFFITHSPFILSDLPKENIIFLKDGKQEYPFKNNQTFGANIHTLLSHGFFMEDGLMGEFAKSKITQVIEILKKPQLSEDEIKDCKHIISIIGEPILQKTLEHQLNEKLNPNETELQKLEREQKEIQEKIAKLKRENNETN